MLATKVSLAQESKAFRELNESNPAMGREILEVGSALESLAASGQYRKLCDKARSLSSLTAAPLRYFSAKAFLKALVAQHLMICAFLLDNGFDVNDYTIPNALTHALKDKTVNDQQCKRIVEFLVSYKYDINRQEDNTFLSPLHYSVMRGFMETTNLLISLKADVNSVSANDIMPLNAAYVLGPDAEFREEIINILVQRGAKETWRKGQDLFETVYRTPYRPVDSSSISTNPSSTQGAIQVSRVRFNSAMLTLNSQELPQNEVSPNDENTSSFVGQSEDGSQLFSTG